MESIGKGSQIMSETAIYPGTIGATMTLDDWYESRKKLQICPFCQSDNVEVMEVPKTIFQKPYAGHCRDCDSRGSETDTIEGAIKAWNSVPREKRVGSD